MVAPEPPKDNNVQPYYCCRISSHPTEGSYPCGAVRHSAVISHPVGRAYCAVRTHRFRHGLPEKESRCIIRWSEIGQGEAFHALQDGSSAFLHEEQSLTLRHVGRFDTLARMSGLNFFCFALRDQRLDSFLNTRCLLAYITAKEPIAIR